MTNKITVQMLFHFKGEEHCYRAEIQLPLHLGGMTEFYYSLPRRIAERNGVDTYSYMFDMMESSPIEVISATGYVARFLENGPVSMDEFVAACNNVTPESLLQDIAENFTLSSQTLQSTITAQADLKVALGKELEQALKQAYEIGLSKGGSQ